MLAFARVARTRTTPQQTTSFQHAVANTVVSTAAAIDVQWGAVTIHDSAAILDAILKAAETEASISTWLKEGAGRGRFLVGSGSHKV